MAVFATNTELPHRAPAGRWTADIFMLLVILVRASSFAAVAPGLATRVFRLAAGLSSRVGSAR